ncbi:MAG: hypothetical protein A2035_03150 [Nitrospirae bacterium GWA2_42_11]|nr:MAG: hypothetical protein A2035_03150 [Nitrospirae bacterium GWA2_42_11]
MTEKKEGVTKTLGQAIDEIIQALQSLEQSSRVTAIKATCEHLNISLIEESKIEHHIETSHRPAMPTTSKTIDIKTLKEQKKPSSAIEMAALVAFYLSEHASEIDRKDEVDVDDMVKYFKQSGFKLPQRPKVLLVNAKNAGYFDSAGGGKYKLNPVGYNLVAHNLPRSQSESPIKGTRAKKRKTKSKPERKRSS